MLQQRADMIYKYTNKNFICIMLIFMGIMQYNNVYSATITAEEYQIKAIYLFNSIGLIQWPEDLAGSSFRLCVLGGDPFGKWLDIAVHDEKIAGKSVVALRIRVPEEAGNCHTVFIADSENDRLGHILKKLPKGILTLGDSEGFVREGGMIEFYINRERQIRVAIDSELMKRNGLNVSAKLLKISTIVNSDSH